MQVHTLLKGLEKIAASADIPMLVAGDFNSVPGSAAHSLLVNNSVDANHPVRSLSSSLSTQQCSHRLHSMTDTPGICVTARLRGCISRYQTVWPEA